MDEIDLTPGEPHGRLRLRVAVTTRRFHVHGLERLTGIRALEGQARLLLNDLHEYQAWLCWRDKRPVGEHEAAREWARAVYGPVVERLFESLPPGRDPVQAYCDVLEHKWLLSEKAGRDVGLETAIASYLKSGAPAPEELGSAVAVDAITEEDPEL